MVGKRIASLILSMAWLATGCTHAQLRMNHNHQAKSLTTIYEQQVLDNLAMFVNNNEAVPFFAIPAGGNARVQDSGAISASPLNGPAHTVLSLTGLSRNSSGDWTILPINQPDKLRRMRCAYRRAIGMANPNDSCVDCCLLEQKFQGKPGDTSVCCDCCAIRPLRLEVIKTHLCHSRCEKIGSYCGTNIRVCPESYGDFTLLVLKILDYALKDPLPVAGPPTAEVVHFHYTPDGKIDYIDKFQATAHGFTPRGVAESGAKSETIVPQPEVELGQPNVMQEVLDNILNERLRQRQRDALFPSF